MIFSHETRLTSRRYPMNGEMGLDDTGKRIERLVAHYLVKVGETAGAGTLFRDPMGGNFWELVVPEFGIHSFSLPELVRLTPDEARQKYGRIAEVR